MINAELAKIFREISIYLDMDNVPFKPRAYEKISEVLGSLEEDLGSIYKRGGLKALKEIPGVGESSALKIEEYIKTGKVKDYEVLKKKTPVQLDELAGIEGLGPKKIKHLYGKLGVKNLKDLEAAIAGGKVSGLEGFGEKSSEKLEQSIGFLRKSGGRFIFGEIAPLLEDIRYKLSLVPGVQVAEIAGSFRRRRDTIGDGDILVISKDPKSVMDYFVKMKRVVQIIGQGGTKSSVKLENGLNVDVRVLEPEIYGAALMHFTGSKDHNIVMRELAIKKGLKLSEYGLTQTKGKTEKIVAGRTEAEIYKKLGMDYIPPEIRENLGEIELARSHKLPKLVEYKDIQGDLQIQTSWTDGKNSIEEMAEAAISLGRKYIVITDHTKRLTVTNGLDEKRILKQMAEIDALNIKFSKQKIDFKILKGSECDILKDGSLDLPDKILAKLDVVGASVHSHFKLSSEEQTRRIKRAMSNPHVDILFHPTGRIINKREAYALDMQEIIKHAKATKTVLEINSFPDRADLKDEYIRKCVELGVKMAIDSDAHAIPHLKLVEYGVYQARRGWAKKSDIINAWPLEKMLKMLK